MNIIKKFINSYKYEGNSDLSASSITEEIRIIILQNRYKPFIMSSSILLGNAFHFAMESITGKQNRYNIQINGISISGQPDYYDRENKILYDFKVVPSKSFLEGLKENYIYQLNIYKYLLYIHGLDVKKMYIVAVYKDFSYYDLLLTNKNYPNSELEFIECREIKDILDYIRQKAILYKMYKDMSEEDLPICKDKYENNSKKLPLKCIAYCSVNNYCSYYKNEVMNKYEDEIEKTIKAKEVFMV